MNHFWRRIGSVAMSLATATAVLAASQTAWAARFSTTEPVSVWIDWSAFKRFGFADNQKAAITDTVVNAYTRWEMVSGSRLKFRFRGYTNRPSRYRKGIDDPKDFFFDNEILVYMTDFHAGRLGSFYSCEVARGGPGRCGQIVLHNRPGATGTPYIWQFWGSTTGNTYDALSVFLHEFGHAHDLDDRYRPGWSDRFSAMGAYNFWGLRFGPSRADTDRAVANYGANDRNRVRMWRSAIPGGENFVAKDRLPGGVRTTMDPAAVRTGSRLAFFYTSTAKTPCFIHGTVGGSWDKSKWFCWGGSKSQYGIAADGDSDEYMWAFVEQEPGKDPRIRLVHSTRGQLERGTGFLRALPVSRTYGTPGIAQVADNTWVLAYSRFDRDDLAKTGRIVARTSTDDGRTWSPEVELGSGVYRVLSGVTATANKATGEVRIGFSWGADRIGRARVLVRTIRAQVTGGRIAYVGMMYGSNFTRTQPVLRKSRSHFHAHFRGTDAATRVVNRVSAPTSSTWSGGRTISNSTTMTTPALAALPSSDWTYMFQVERTD